MENLISEFNDKLNVKKHLFLQTGTYKIYRNIYKAETNIEKEILNDKLVDVMDTCKVNNENFYLISSQANELGWVIVENPLFICSTFPEKVVVMHPESRNIINEKLNLIDDVKVNVIYTKKYFIVYQEKIYIGIVKDDSLVSFLPASQISNGDVEPISFKFNHSRINLFEDIYKKINFQFIYNNDTFECDKILFLTEGPIGRFKNGKTRYWFNLSDTDINLENDIKIPEKSLNYFLLEHLFYSQSRENNSPQKDKTISIEEKIVRNRFADYREQIETLREENKSLKLRLENGLNPEKGND